MNASILTGMRCAMVILLITAGTKAVNIETVTVDNVGNPGELAGAGAGGDGTDRICGAGHTTTPIPEARLIATN